jgi:hypothetical protein
MSLHNTAKLQQPSSFNLEPKLWTDSDYHLTLEVTGRKKRVVHRHFEALPTYR